MRKNPLNNLRPYRNLIFRTRFRKKLRKNSLIFSKKKPFYRKSLVITSWFVGKTIWIHNGRKALKRKIASRTVGLSAGQLVMTRAFFEHKKKKQKKKKALLAQMVEHWPSKPRVRGSSPLGRFCRLFFPNC